MQQYPRRFLKNGILRRGQADQRRGTLEQLILPSSLRLDVPREVRHYISSCERCTVVPCFRKKGFGYDAGYGRSVMPCVCMLWVALRVLNLCKLSGIGLELACNLTVLLFLVLRFYDLACFLLHGPVVC